MTLLAEVANRLEPQQAIILRDLIDNQMATTKRLVNQVWGHDVEGGPLNAEEIIRIQISRMRHQLKPGWSIIFFLRAYRLTYTDAEQAAA